jgi:hypothetical protein
VAVKPFAPRLVEEGRGIVAAAGAAGLTVRLLGGVGIRLLLGPRLDPVFARPLRDVDVLVRRREARGLEGLLAERGWQAASEFNALNGARRLLFREPGGEAQVDVFVEVFEMCHRLPLAEGLDSPGPSLPATDLLLSKLQIVELNAKDASDCLALLHGCELRAGDPAALDSDRLATLTSRDWGLQHTLELNLARLRDRLTAVPLAADARSAVERRVAELERAMSAAPKSRGWKLRAKVGERRRWYEDVEEVERAAR